MDMLDFTKLSSYLAPFSKDEILIVMEATGIYHLTLLSYLLEQELNVSVVNPLFIHAFTKSMTIRKTKTDAKDAHIISIFAKRNYATIRLSRSLSKNTPNNSQICLQMLKNIFYFKNLSNIC